MVEAVPAQAVEAAGSGVAVHYSLTTPARGGKKRMKCVINCSILFPTVRGCRRRTVFVQMYCDISSPSRLTRRSPPIAPFPRLTRQQLPTVRWQAIPSLGVGLCRALRRVCGRRCCKLKNKRFSRQNPVLNSTEVGPKRLPKDPTPIGIGSSPEIKGNLMSQTPLNVLGRVVRRGRKFEVDVL